MLEAGYGILVPGDGSVQSPYVIELSCETVQDCVAQAFGNGLQYDDPTNTMSVKLSAVGGNTTIFGADGGIYTPSSPVSLGCGLEFGGSGQIQVDVVAFGSFTRQIANDAVGGALGNAALGSADQLGGQGIYCEPSAGDIRTKPEKFTLTQQQSVSETFGPATIPFTCTEIQLSVTNPSPYYAMCGFLNVACLFNESSVAASNPETFFAVDLADGVGFVEFKVRARDTRGFASVTREGVRPSQPLNVCLDPSETKIFKFKVRWAQGSVAGAGTTQILDAGREIRFFGVNL